MFDRAHALRLAKVAQLGYEKDDERLRAGIDALGFAFAQRFDDAATDTQTILVWNAKEAVFAARGTEKKLADMLTDLKFRRQGVSETAAGPPGVSPGASYSRPPPGRVHRGFLAAWRSISEQVGPAIYKLAFEGRTVEATGHSLGGALAILAAVETKAIKTVVTFGAPRVGDAAFAATCRKRFAHWRIVRGCDAVPLVPLISMGNRHDRPSIYIDGDGVIHEGAHIAVEAWHRVKGLFSIDWLRVPTGLGLGPLAFLPARAVADHALAGYIDDLKGKSWPSS